MPTAQLGVASLLAPSGSMPRVKSYSLMSMGIRPLEVRYPERAAMGEIKITSPVLFDDIDSAVAACVKAQRTFMEKSTLEHRKAILNAIRDVCNEFKEDFAWCAWSETGRGRYDDKVTKQNVAINHTPGVEDLKPTCYTGDDGMTVVDLAPYGVIGAVTPVTNPTATIINNAITILAGGNGVVFNPHPGATLCTNRAVAIVNEAIVMAGGPESLVCSVKSPTIQSGQRLMTHPDTSANLITGGPAVVKVALASGKRSFCAGPGNPPVIVDDTADIVDAAKHIVDGAAFDNNMICSDEKQVFAMENVADKLIEEMMKHGAYMINEAQTEELMKVVFPSGVPPLFSHGDVDKHLVGHDATEFLERIGITDCPADTKLVICKVEEGHPLIWTEQLMPILPICPVTSFSHALEIAKKTEYGFRHTSSIYSQNLHHISQAAKHMNTSMFIVNGAHTAGLAVGGEGYTSFSIAGSTGEGLTRPSTFVRERKVVCVGALRFV
eukprot:Protomagalhaensia_sp_Gyna_25__1161@NODE_1570_length_1723_cov_1175_894893_g1277_i0_p1_GENE_NODE_1570_length_1723_cov_1175_894893_g1277_i0NODE_1570_length_1723_cov_1175_894893_g1277_i0_p1_ORF_typecomplete_len495_score75_53Aldedh/PF00171_22/6_9e58MtmB/PF05369_12/3_4MtmB/PF05369_12/36DUF1487/PF07368_11/2_3e03DUF1487/PF07368_11/25DUF1487/PF07368_11/9_1_NODE_1570_length_1723_cov_1175_894893_g1277_i01711655